MKKVIPYLLVIGLFIISCKKEHSGTPAPNPADTTRYNVTFNVSGFSQTIKTASKSKQVNSQAINSDIQNNVTVLYYYVRRLSGNGIGLTLRQDTTSENFGTLSDRLAAGKYGIYIVAGQDGLSSSAPMVSYNGRWKDTFYKGDTITVSDTPIVKDLTLGRVVGQLEVNITDLIPTNADNIVVTVKSDFGRMYLSPAPIAGQDHGYDPFDVNDTTKIPVDAKGKIGLKIKPIILINTREAFNVNITCYDASKKILGSAIVSDLTCERNTRTLLTGNLFNTNNSPSVILAPWNPNPVNVPF